MSTINKGGYMKIKVTTLNSHFGDIYDIERFIKNNYDAFELAGEELMEDLLVLFRHLPTEKKEKLFRHLVNTNNFQFVKLDGDHSPYPTFNIRVKNESLLEYIHWYAYSLDSKGRRYHKLSDKTPSESDFKQITDLANDIN